MPTEQEHRQAMYVRQERSAAQRAIRWDFTPETWWAVWEASGKWKQRGRKRDEFVMARFKDEGPYSPANVRICTVLENLREKALFGRSSGNGKEAAQTPLARLLRSRGITGQAFAAKLGVTQPAMSRAIRHCQMTLELAVAICDEVDPRRQVIDERYLLLAKVAPTLYGEWPVMDTPRPVSPLPAASVPPS